jgi:polyferredoxin
VVRTPLKLDVIRDRGSMGREVEDGIIENVYRLQIINTDERGHRYRISASGIDGLTVDPPSPSNGRHPDPDGTDPGARTAWRG